MAELLACSLVEAALVFVVLGGGLQEDAGRTGS